MSSSDDTWTPLDGADPNQTIRPRGDLPPNMRTRMRDIRALPPEDELRMGQTIGKGGMGIVRAADQRSLGRTVAIKSVRPDQASEAAVASLIEEAWVTGSLEHPNIVPVYDIMQDEHGRPHIVLKRITGTPWTHLMGDPEAARAEFGVEDLLGWNLRVLIQVSHAVGFAHSHRIVHRDLKPDNVMIGPFGEVYVLDWGIAVSLDDRPEGRLPRAADQRQLAGTPCYMAPEMLTGDGRALSTSTDVYQLGGLLFQVLSGRAPHRGWPTSDILSRIPDFVPALPDAPAELAALVARTMQPDPNTRTPSAEAFRSDIERHLAHRGSDLIARQTADRLVELRSLCLQDPTAELRRAIYDALAACRFGFRAALETWPENPTAQAGMQEALRLVVTFELDQGDDRSAEILLPSMVDVDPALEARRLDLQRARLAKGHALEEYQRNHDQRLGVRTRLFLIITLGAVWITAPLITWYATGFAGPQSQVVRSLLQLGGACLFVVWARRTMEATIINRTTLTMVVAMTITMLALQVGMHRVGAPPDLLAYAQLMVFACWASAAAIAIDRRLYVAAAGYLGCFGLATWHLADAMAWTALGNAILIGTIAFIWLPDVEHVPRPR